MKIQGNFRWVVCGLLFAATAINYMDRQIIGLLKPTLQESFHFDERGYAAIAFSFQLAYALGLLAAGRMMDWLGTRLGLGLALLLWSLAAMAHAFAGSFPQLSVPSLILNPPSIVMLTGACAGFAVARFALGLGEAGNFPAAIKTVAEWFPKKERALATGIFNSGSNVGAVLTPLIVPWITVAWGWQAAFLVTGAGGLLWLVFWILLYRAPQAHRSVTPAELSLILSDHEVVAPPLRWSALFKFRQTWAFALGKFMTDPIWWLYLIWVPGFLSQKHGLSLPAMGLPIVAIYLSADLGSIGGGWLSSTLLKRGWSANRARKTAMLICALAVLPMLAASRASSLWGAVGLISLAAAAHQGWSANLFTLVSDMFPRQAVGSVVGIGGMAGAIGSMFISLAVGEILQASGNNYAPVFMLAGLAYLAALAMLHLLAPTLEPSGIPQ